MPKTACMWEWCSEDLDGRRRDRDGSEKMARKKAGLTTSYLAIGLGFAALAFAMWATGMHGRALAMAGSLGVTGTGIWHCARVSQRDRRMAVALRSAMQSGVIGGKG